MNTRQKLRRSMKLHFEGMQRDLDWLLKHSASVELTMAEIHSLGDGTSPLTDEQIAQLPDNWQLVVYSLRTLGVMVIDLQTALQALRKQV